MIKKPDFLCFFVFGALARKFRQAAEIDWGLGIGDFRFQISDFRFGTGDEE
jgi:hypothetical protein